jgi:16S rRNA (cytosine1402-N4)-methyltransferase
MHEPVLLEEAVTSLAIRPDGTYVDGTAGSGGHSGAVAARLGPGGRLLSIDRDPDALERTRQRVGATTACRWSLAHGRFGDMKTIARQHGIRTADGVLLDLGVSSEQLDTPTRGFSFQSEGPLDMRMDPSAGQTAADLVAGLDEPSLADLIREFGEERRARRIARSIVRAREQEPIRTTAQLAAIVARAAGRPAGPRHPATRTFQALRMAVNDELGELRHGLEQGLELLRTGGRLAVITFHSLEDREVKQFMRAHVPRHESLQQGGSRVVCNPPPVKLVTRKPVSPTQAEVDRNPRARSARLRAAERLDNECLN